MTKKDSGNKTLTVLVPVIVAVLTLIGVMMQTDWFAARMTPTTPTIPPTATEANVPTSEPVNISTVVPSETAPPPTATPVPPPLMEVFPQAEKGEVFVFVNKPAVFTNDFVRENCVRSGVYGLKLAYDIKNSGSSGWGVQWENSAAGFFDATPYSALLFWVKGGTGSEKFQVGMKDDFKREHKIESSDLVVLSTDWQLVRVPLSSFGEINRAFVNNVNFGFNANHSNGLICIDDISFE